MQGQSVPLAILEGAQPAGMDHILTFASVSLTKGKPTIEIQKYVTPRTKGPRMLQDIVLTFAPGHEAVKLLSSDGTGVEINLEDVVEGLQAGDEVPGITQDTQAKTGVILVGAPQRPIQKQENTTVSPSIATPTPGAPAAKVYKQGRMQSSDPSKSKVGQRTAKLLPTDSHTPLHDWTRSLFSRDAEAPWLFRSFEDQPLNKLLVKGLLQRPEFAGENGSKVEHGVKRFITNQNGELRRYHSEKDNPAVKRGSKTYAAAEEEAGKWHAECESFDWKCKDLPQAVWAFLETQGLNEENIMQLAGLKGPSKHSSAADENTHFTPATNKGKEKRTRCEEEQPEAAEDDNDDEEDAAEVLTSIDKGQKAAVQRRKEAAKRATLKRKQRAMEATDAGPDAAGNSTQQGRHRKDKGPKGGKGGRGGGNGSRGKPGPTSKKKT